MPYVLVRHKVADFSKWKPAYDAHLPARKEADLREKMQEAGVVDKPDIYFLE